MDAVQYGASTIPYRAALHPIRKQRCYPLRSCQCGALYQGFAKVPQGGDAGVGEKAVGLCGGYSVSSFGAYLWESMADAIFRVKIIA